MHVMHNYLHMYLTISKRQRKIKEEQQKIKEEQQSLTKREEQQVLEEEVKKFKKTMQLMEGVVKEDLSTSGSTSPAVQSVSKLRPNIMSRVGSFASTTR